MEKIKLHLGCATTYIEGWINIDADPKFRTDMNFDVRNEFPFQNKTVDFIFNEHLIEHLRWEEGMTFMEECHRVLKPEGVLRISTPNLEWMVKIYLEGKLNEWEDSNWVPISSCHLLNEGLRRWHHKFIYDKAELYNSLKLSGFSVIEDREWRKSSYPELTMLEHRPYHHDLIIEARK
jgi:predicted SAM-dependent methyltransferase